MNETPWIVRFKPLEAPKHRLFCFPYAGTGSSVYRLWPGLVPKEVEICAILAPGREGRMREKPLESIEAISSSLFPAIRSWLDRPFSFFGHSLGALVAFEMCRKFRREGINLPETLFVSARMAPQRPSQDEALHHLPDALFIEMMKKRYSGIPKVILEDSDLLALFIPVMKADMKVVETYHYTEEAPLACPINAFVGLRDPRASEEGVRAWSSQTTGTFQLHRIEGDHFFIQDRRKTLVEEIVKALRGKGID